MEGTETFDSITTDAKSMHIEEMDREIETLDSITIDAKSMHKFATHMERMDRIAQEKAREENDKKILKQLMRDIQLHHSRYDQYGVFHETSLELSDRVRQILIDKGYTLRDFSKTAPNLKFTNIFW